MRFKREQIVKSALDWDRAEEINLAFDELSASRLERHDLDETLEKSKLAWKFAVLRHSLNYRLVDLGEACMNTWSTGDHLAAIVLARAFLETAALLHSVCYRTERALETDSLESLDDLVMKESFGSRRRDWIQESGYEATNVMTALDHMGKEIEFARDFYEDISETAHPNSFGVHQFYSKIDKENFVVHFSRNKRSHDDVFSKVSLALYFSVWSLKKLDGLDKMIDEIAERQHQQQPVGQQPIDR